MAVPMKNGGMSSGKVLFYVILSGITTGIGAFVGKIIGGISENDFDLPNICSRSDVVHSFRRTNTGIKLTI